MAENPYQTPQSEIANPHSQHVKPDMKELLFSFDGRVPRRVFWGVSLISAAISLALQFGLMAIDETLGLIAIVIMIVPAIWISLAVTIKRWHDRDKSGYWIFIQLIPIVGPIWAFVECGCLRGTEGDNNYGADPT